MYESNKVYSITYSGEAYGPFENKKEAVRWSKNKGMNEAAYSFSQADSMIDDGIDGEEIALIMYGIEITDSFGSKTPPLHKV